MIGRKSLLIVLSKAISAVLGFVGLFLIARNFLPSTYGQIAYTMSLVALFNSFSDLGFATSHIKRISEGKDPSDCLSSYLVVKMLLTGAMVAAILIFFWTWTSMLDRPLNDTSFGLIALFTLYFVLYNIAQVATATFDAHLQTAKTQLALISEMLVRVPLIILFAIPMGDVYSLALCYVIGGLAVAIVSLLLLYRTHLKLKRPTLIRSFAVFALPLAISVVLGIIIANVDKVSLGFFWSSTEVANYSAGQSILNMLYVFGGALSTLLFPTFSRLHENGDKSSMREIVQRGERYLSYIITPIVCVFLVFPALIADVIFTGKYAGAAEVMRVLSLTVLILSLGSVYSTHIVAMNRAKELVWLMVFQLFLLLSLLTVFVPTSFFQIPMMGLRATGTAWASLLTTLVIVVLARLIIWRMIGLGFNRKMLGHFVAALLSLLALLSIGAIYDPSRWFDIILAWGVSAAVFYVFLYAVRELRRSDIDYFLEVINPMEMARYIKSEIMGKR